MAYRLDAAADANILHGVSVSIRALFFGVSSSGVLQHPGAVFHGSGFREALEDATEIGGIAKSAADRNVFEFEIVMAQKKFAARDADVNQVIDERHVSMAVKHAREMVRADGKNVRHGIACDVVLIVALQIDADAFEETLAAIFGFRRGGFMDQPFDALNQRLGQI